MICNNTEICGNKTNKKQQQTCETLEILHVKIGVKQGTWNLHTYAY